MRWTSMWFGFSTIRLYFIFKSVNKIQNLLLPLFIKVCP